MKIRQAKKKDSPAYQEIFIENSKDAPKKSPPKQAKQPLQAVSARKPRPADSSKRKDPAKSSGKKSKAKAPSRKAESPAGDPEALKALEARKIQMMAHEGAPSGGESFPLQMHIVRSESLHIAQERIDSLKEELDKMRKLNQSLSSASGVLQNKNDRLKSRLEEMAGSLKEEREVFKNEKDVFVTALEDAAMKINRLQSENKKWEERLSRDFQNIREREGALESRIEILKMENTALQREKDKKIIELKKHIRKNADILQAQQKKHQTLHEEISRLREGSRRAVSTLRALIFHLEGVKAPSSDEMSQTGLEQKKAS